MCSSEKLPTIALQVQAGLVNHWCLTPSQMEQLFQSGFSRVDYILPRKIIHLAEYRGFPIRMVYLKHDIW